MITDSVVLYFLDTKSLSDFFIENSISNVTVDTKELSITGELSERLIGLAQLQYKSRADKVLTFSF